jgi:hypothetical protein
VMVFVVWLRMIDKNELTSEATVEITGGRGSTKTVLDCAKALLLELWNGV